MKTALQTETETILREKIRIHWKNYGQLRKLEDSLARHYNAGTISQAGFKRMDLMIFQQLAKLAS